MVKSYYYLYVFYVCNILLFIILYNIYYTDEKKKYDGVIIDNLQRMKNRISIH